jgi:hypothetical protein
MPVGLGPARRWTERAIGITNLHNIDLHHGTADFGLMIGEADARGRGLTTASTCLMRDYAFHHMGPHHDKQSKPVLAPVRQIPALVSLSGCHLPHRESGQG